MDDLLNNDIIAIICICCYVSNKRALKESLKVTHGARGAQGQVVHLLGERSHDSGWVDGQTGLDGRSRGDHSTLRPAERHMVDQLKMVGHHMKKEQISMGI